MRKRDLLDLMEGRPVCFVSVCGLGLIGMTLWSWHVRDVLQQGGSLYIIDSMARCGHDSVIVSISVDNHYCCLVAVCIRCSGH